MLIKISSLKDLLKFSTLSIWPHHQLSRLLGFLSRNENEAWKNLIIRRFGKRYNVNTKEALSRNLNRYPSFNAFFTRALKPGVRPITELGNGIACPADGVVSQVGKVTGGEVIQAKGNGFSVTALLGGESRRAEIYKSGIFATIVLSPRDYHRIHMPFDGTLLETVHVPGRLFSISSATVNWIPDLFARNERVVSYFDTEAGPMALILVGSIFSSSIETVWDGVITPPTYSEIRHWNYPYNPPSAKKGEEMGRFNMGSTVILLFAGEKVSWEANMIPGAAVKMGELIGKTRI